MWHIVCRTVSVILPSSMKKSLVALIFFGAWFTACNKEPEALTKTQIQQKVDSITAYRIKELDEQAQKDLGHRMKIEVKVKADSIANAAEHPKDSVAKKLPTPMPPANHKAAMGIINK